MLDRFQAWWGRRARWQKIVLIIVAISVVFGPFISDIPADKQDEVAQSATTTNATDTPSTTAVTEKFTTGATESATSTTTTVPEAPPNPGDAVGCADFDTWEEAQESYDTYAPYYGDIALLDINNNGVACEKLLAEGVTVEQVAATVTTAPATSTAAAAAPSTVTEAEEATRLEALFGLLAELRTAVENDAGYDRSDYDHDRRYLCNTAGVDPYTGLRFESSTCDADHIVAAKEAHESGGHAWDRSTRRQFGDDALNLVASRDCVNRSKGSRDPAEWSGVRSGTCGGAALTTEGRCFWAARTVAVKYRYDLAVDTAERAALRTSLTNCPDNIDIEAPPRATPKAAAPTSTSPATATTTAPPTSTSPATATTTAPQTGGCHPAYEPCLPNLAGDALNCGDLTSAQRPVRVKQIGVDPYRLDRDQDGNGCE